MEVDVNIPPDVFNKIYYAYLHEDARIQIYYGGSGSGKSVFLAQRAVFDLMNGGRNYLITRKVGRTLRNSVFAEVLRVIGDWGVGRLFNVNKSEMAITCVNGYEIIFIGLDDPEKLKSIVPKKGAITDVWVEEATECARDDVKQLLKRQRGGSSSVPKRLTMSFNPILRTHWIFQDYFSHISMTDTQTSYKAHNLSILHTWHIHNRFLTESDRSDLENETDSYYYNVYTLGLWGVLGNVIFTNWTVEDLSNRIDQFINRHNGLDFGYAANPAAVIMTHYDRAHKMIYIFGELYETGLTNDMLASKTLEMINKDSVICDSAEPKSIAELQKYGVRAVPAKKGKDSVSYGIQWLKQQRIVIDTSCVNTKNEMEQYKWREDKNGNALPEPVDKNNHLIDALRYAYETDSAPLMAQPAMKSRWGRSYENRADDEERPREKSKWRQ